MKYRTMGGIARRRQQKNLLVWFTLFCLGIFILFSAFSDVSGSHLKRAFGSYLKSELYQKVLHFYAPLVDCSGNNFARGELLAHFMPLYEDRVGEQTMQDDYIRLAVRENQNMERFVRENAAAVEKEKRLQEKTIGAKELLEEQQRKQGKLGEQQGVQNQQEEQGVQDQQVEQDQQEAQKEKGEDEQQAPQKGENPQNAENEKHTTEDVAQTIQKKASFPIEKSRDFDYLLQNYYLVDAETTANRDLIKVDRLLEENLSVSKNESGPQILIYHTHSLEGYADSVPGDRNQTVVGIGSRLEELLTQKYGWQVYHDTHTYDTVRDNAYSCALPNLQRILAENPSIQMVIDVHRDGVPETLRLVTEQDGKSMAKIMFFNGMCCSSVLGDLTGCPNPYLAQNLALSFQLQKAAAEYYPGFTRKIYLKAYRYNMHLCPKSILVEVGAQTNTFQEAFNAMEPLAFVIDHVLTGD